VFFIFHVTVEIIRFNANSHSNQPNCSKPNWTIFLNKLHCLLT